MGKKPSRADQRLINEGIIPAHEGDPLTDAMMNKNKIRVDDSTFRLLYSISWPKVLEHGM